MTTSSDAAGAFLTLASSEERQVPMYARLCREIAERPDAAGLLLEAPVAQRLPVLLLAALHEAVLCDPDSAVGAWYPSVGGDPDHHGDLGAALEETLEEHREQIVASVRSRQVQTNEVNRCVAWRAALARACSGDDRPLALIELGCSAGLNLSLDRYSITFEGAGLDGPVGPAEAAVRLGTTVRSGPWSTLGDPMPRICERIGIDLCPLDVTDPDDTRWLTACIWPEQVLRLERLRAALDVTAAAPPDVIEGDIVDQLGHAFERVGQDRHVVVLSSWALGYIERQRRSELQEQLSGLGTSRAARGGRVTVLTFEADHVVPWVQAPDLPADAAPELRHASLLAATDFDDQGLSSATVIARCQAHLAWMDRQDPPET